MLTKTEFNHLKNWEDVGSLGAFFSFKNSQQDSVSRPLNTNFIPLIQALHALRLKAENADINTKDQAKHFFEQNFTPYKISLSDRSENKGLITGYFEPEVKSSKTPSKDFSAPILRLPKDHKYPDQLILPEDIRFPSRQDYINASADIVEGKTNTIINQEDIIGWLDPVDAFFIHIQGSAVLSFDTENKLRIAYAGRNGHPYRSIGKYLINLGYFKKGELTYEKLKNWLKAHPDKVNDIFAYNASYIYFAPSKNQDMSSGPIAAAGVALTPQVSIAIDRKFYPYHLPIWAEYENLDGKNTQNLFITQDTGAAIKGAIRADLFFGRGEEAGLKAGAMQQDLSFTLFLPNSISPQDYLNMLEKGE